MKGFITTTGVVISIALMLADAVIETDGICFWIFRAFYIPVYVLACCYFILDEIRKEKAESRRKIKERKERLQQQWENEYAAYRKERRSNHG